MSRVLAVDVYISGRMDSKSVNVWKCATSPHRIHLWWQKAKSEERELEILPIGHYYPDNQPSMLAGFYKVGIAGLSYLGTLVYRAYLEMKAKIDPKI